jgi:maleate isomerase
MSERFTLGVVLPDDGPYDYEWLRLEPWLASHGFAHIAAPVVRSTADGIMVPERLRAIGRDAVLVPCARALKDKGAQAILWACTTGSFIAGRADAEAQAEAIHRATGLPSPNTSLAMAEAAKALGGREVDVLSAYTEEVTAIFAQFLRDSGLSIGVTEALGCVHTRESFEVDPIEEARRFAAANPGRATPLLIPDTAINTLARLTGIRRAAKRPIVTANQASLWHALAIGRAHDGRDPSALFGL